MNSLKSFILLLFILACLFGCACQRKIPEMGKICNGGRYSGVVIAPNDLFLFVDSIIGGVRWTIGLDKERRVCYVGTKDEKFNIFNYKVGMTLDTISYNSIFFSKKFKNPILHLGDFWYAGFDDSRQSLNSKSVKIDCLFKYSSDLEVDSTDFLKSNLFFWRKDVPKISIQTQ